MNLKANKTMAMIYLAFFIVSALIAFVLFKFLPGSSADAGGSLLGIDFKAGGAIAGFIISFAVLAFLYHHFMTTPVTGLRISGNVFDAEENPLKGVTIAVDPERGSVLSDDNGRFEMEVSERDKWTVRARKSGYDNGKVDVDANQIHEPVRILLKKKLK
jgi:hypothetical protein